MPKIILIILGGLMIFFSFSKIRTPLINRLFNQGYVTPQRPSRESAEIIANTGPSISLFAIGVVFILIGIIL